jgi:hypothetical protein
MDNKIVRRTTGGKGCYFVAGFFKVINVFLEHLLKVSEQVFNNGKRNDSRVSGIQAGLNSNKTNF